MSSNAVLSQIDRSVDNVPFELKDVSLETFDDQPRLFLEGCLSVNNVGEYRSRVIEVMVENPDLEILDLSRAELSGSSVIALLISIQRFAQSEKRKLTIAQAQPKLLEMAAMNGLQDILPLSED